MSSRSSAESFFTRAKNPWSLILAGAGHVLKTSWCTCAVMAGHRASRTTATDLIVQHECVYERLCVRVVEEAQNQQSTEQLSKSGLGCHTAGKSERSTNQATRQPGNQATNFDAVCDVVQLQQQCFWSPCCW